MIRRLLHPALSGLLAVGVLLGINEDRKLKRRRAQVVAQVAGTPAPSQSSLSLAFEELCSSTGEVAMEVRDEVRIRWVRVIGWVSPDRAAAFEAGKIVGYEKGCNFGRRKTLRLVADNPAPGEVYAGRHATG